MAILVTRGPEQVCDILNGIKTGDIIKNKALANAIKKEIAEKGKATIYVAIHKMLHDSIELLRLYHDDSPKGAYYYTYKLRCQCNEDDFDSCDFIYCDEIVCKFECKNIEEIHYYKHVEPKCDIGVGVLDSFEEEGYCGSEENYEDHSWIYAKSKMSYDELDKYLNKKSGYFIHISNLTIFEKPKEIDDTYKKGFNEALNDFLKTQRELMQKGHYPSLSPYKIYKKYELRKAPINFVYVEDSNLDC